MTARPRAGASDRSRANRVLEIIAWVTGRSRRRSERMERVLVAIAGLVFVAATVWAWRQLPDGRGQFRASWLVVVALLGVLSLWLNAMEFRVSASMLGRTLPPGEALRVSVLGSAANLLPIPGAAAVRTRSLLQLGERTRMALSVTVAVGVAWVGTAALVAGLALIAFGREHILLAGLFLLAALVSTAAVLALLRLAKGSAAPKHLSVLLGVELASVLVSGLRLYAVARAAEFGVTLSEAIAINLGGILSHAAGIFPGGLGIKELMSGVFAGFVGIAASVGVLMAALDRLAMYAVLAFASLPLLRPWRRGTAPNAERVDPDTGTHR